LERLLAEQVATSWAALQLADLDASKEQGWLERAEFYDRRHHWAHKRYVDSVVALARVRRLLTPLVAQVNIAEAGAQQLNVAGQGQTPAIPTAADQVRALPPGDPQGGE
jgi:hypothetical protein